MIQVDKNIEDLFLSDSVHKYLTIEVESEINADKLHACNVYTGDIYGASVYSQGIGQFKNAYTTSYYMRSNNSPVVYTWDNYINKEFLHNAKYIYMSVEVCISNLSASGTMPDKIGICFTCKKDDGTTVSAPKCILETTGMISNDWSSYKTFTTYIETANINSFYYVWYTNEDQSSAYASDINIKFRKIQFRLLDEIPSTVPSYTQCPIWDGETIKYYITGGMDDIINENLIQESFSLTESLCSQDNLKFGLCESAHCEFETVGRTEKFIGKTIKPYISPVAGEKGIPLGVFKVSEVKKNHTTEVIKKSITAYDKLEILDQEVGDWLTKYMWLWDTGYKQASDSPGFTKFGVEYARQLFPTLANLMQQLNILKPESFTKIMDLLEFDVTPANYNYSYNYLWGNYEDDPRNKGTIGLLFGASSSAGYSEPRLIRFDLTPYGNLTDAELFGRFAYSDMGSYWDSNYHGFPSCASVFVILHNSDGTDTKILADSGDYIYLDPRVTGYEFYYSAGIARINPSGTMIAAGDKDRMITSHVKVSHYEVPELFKGLVNAHLRLVYYNYGTQEMGSFNSSTTGRDVVQSLLEVNGCFFHMNRYGEPEIIYASKAGLYPRNDLYPALDLYPRGMNGPLLSMSRYISMECDDYIVENYGRIQIKTDSQVKSGESICSYEYVGNPDAKNTYIIEDNIFYCASGTVYEYGSQPEVDEMLKNLFTKISNLNFTPHTTQLRGLPFMECGDRVNLVTLTGGMESFIFRRTLKGIHALRDTYEAIGDEYNEALNTFDYNVYKPQ